MFEYSTIIAMLICKCNVKSRTSKTYKYMYLIYNMYKYTVTCITCITCINTRLHEHVQVRDIMFYFIVVSWATSAKVFIQKY